MVVSCFSSSLCFSSFSSSDWIFCASSWISFSSSYFCSSSLLPDQLRSLVRVFLSSSLDMFLNISQAIRIVYVWRASSTSNLMSLLRSNLSPCSHRPSYPSPALWRTHSGTCEKWHSLKTLALDSSEYGLYMPLRHLLQKTLGKCPFAISAVSQCTARANGGKSTKGVRYIAHCLSVSPALTRFSKVSNKLARDCSCQLMSSIWGHFPRTNPTQAKIDPTQLMLSSILSPARMKLIPSPFPDL